MSRPRLLLLGAAAGLGGRALVARVLLAKLRHDVARLNEGDYGPLLAGYAEEAVLHFNPGDHRWAGDHVGKPAIERFLQDFVGAGLRGEITGVWFGGPPWSMTLVARFDDESVRPGGEVLYRNRTALVARTRWGRIVEQWDFYEDTERIGRFEQRLREFGVRAAA